MFADWEVWSFMDSFYFCFTTLTTIGFGDIVLDINHSHDPNTCMRILKVFILSVYTLLGMAFISMAFDLIKHELDSKVQKIPYSD